MFMGASIECRKVYPNRLNLFYKNSKATLMFQEHGSVLPHRTGPVIIFSSTNHLCGDPSATARGFVVAKRTHPLFYGKIK